MLAGTPVRGMFLGGDRSGYHRKLRKKDKGQRSQRRDAMGRWPLGGLPGCEPELSHSKVLETREFVLDPLLKISLSSAT